MYTTQSYLNAEIEYRTSKVRESWGGRRRRGGKAEREPAARPVPGDRTRSGR
jgi:hypothetical protein